MNKFERVRGLITILGFILLWFQRRKLPTLVRILPLLRNTWRATLVT